MRQLVGEFDPAMAPLLLSYGKALYELAFSQQGVMGKEDTSKQQDELGEFAI
jgi:HAT1-interacting factor 1